MTIYENARIKLRESMDKEMLNLDEARASLGEKEYWNQFKLIQDKYAERVKEVDEAERNRRTLQQAKETGIAHDRPEQRYVDIMGQLKAQKITELVAKLAECSSSDKVDNLSTEDPFYYDKLDPIGTFERWWNEEMESLPSYDQIQEFLRRVDINEQGFITYTGTRASKTSALETSKDFQQLRDFFSQPQGSYQENLKEFQNVLRADMFKTPRQRSLERNQAKQAKLKKTTPLFANSSHSKKVDARKKQARRYNSAISRLQDIVYSYDLDPDLESLLLDHLEYICVPQGFMKDDQYRPMLEQFLRYVPDKTKRMQIVREAISRGWRILSDGTI